ncbi:ARF-binding protein [Emydomyces testavorans]|uniref:ARF-binding protein n=1 Tax=Emydomyces testavorans TaxID=2070801 RepID=A0AAF0DD89_9EURO|nr:ARF-binding protein [Emydomyces testavorans]
MAARDRFGAYAEPARSTLQRYIYNACDPHNFEPNLALNLEVVDLLNSKKGNAPREAAFTIVQLINSRNANVALLALALLDICVKNCGYPFHLQISAKEFLNELVRRFPERPPIRPSRVQQRILECLEEWRQTICQTSRYKEDLGYIRDMHRLLLYKGYMFPEVRREDAAVLNPSDNLQSAEEMEEEEKEAQSAKLQELIRRGGPEDLREANRLMKIMAGYDTRHKTDYRAKAAEEVAKVQQKARILEEMLQNHKPGDKIAEGDVFEELANALRSAHPKIQKMCEEESEDAEAVAKLLEINDSIHRTIERYKLVKAGDAEGAAKIPKGTLGTSTGVKKNAENELSLIDFDEPSSNGNASVTQAQSVSSLENDLLGLSFQDSQPSGSISLPLEHGTGTLNQTAIFAPSNSQPQTSLPSDTAVKQSTATPRNDPFASLVSGSSRTSSPFSQLQSHGMPSSSPPSLLNLGQSVSPSNTQPAVTKSPGEDEWTFASALPEESLPTSSQVQVLNSSIKVEFNSRRIPGEKRIQVLARFSNNTNQVISELHFQVAIEKAYKLQLSPQSGRRIAPLQQNGVCQELQLHGIEQGSGNSVRLRYRISYKLGQESKQEDGHVPPLGIV